jgi:hypothetical protein
MTAASHNRKSVFINCPFDGAYLPLFRATVFTVARCGFRPRCALEVNNSADIRIEKIARIIKECPIGIHDISRTEPDSVNGLPRFNMPLELGLYLGARYFGGRTHRSKACLILDREPYRYQKFISDIAGQDVATHGDDAREVIKAVRDFLNSHNGPEPLPDRDRFLWPEYQRFQSALPEICNKLQIAEADLQFPDFLYIVKDYVSEDSPEALASRPPP